MDVTARQRLPIPDKDDVGALALYMQELSQRLDKRLYEINQQLARAANVPAIVYENPENMTFPARQETAVHWSPVFANIEPNPNQFRTFRPYFPFPGLWNIGMWVEMTPVGTANANSHRQAQLRVENLKGEVLFEIVPRDYEGSGTEMLTANTHFYVDPNDPMSKWVYVLLRLRHGNTGSDMRVPAGRARLWMIYNGPGS